MVASASFLKITHRKEKISLISDIGDMISYHELLVLSSVSPGPINSPPIEF